MDLGILDTAHGTIPCQVCGQTEGFCVEWHPEPDVVATRYFCPHCDETQRLFLARIAQALKSSDPSVAREG